MIDEKLKYKIALSLIPKIGHITAKRLVSYIGSYEGVFKESERNLLKIPGIGEILAKNIATTNALTKADKEIEFIDKENIHVTFYLDKDYPERLKHCEDAPVLLYSKSKINLNKKKVISIVGTRKATVNGVSFCERLISDLTERGHDPIIVSGLAYGIDAVAHKAALDNKLETVAVLGHGLDIIYPASHKKMAREIQQNGMLLTDFPSESIRDKNNFIKRNRIIAGLSDATIVIESGEKGGSLVTADLANSYNRDVFAVPGRVSDEYSKGCNKLIKINKAAMLTSVSDLEYILGWEIESKKAKTIQKELFINLTEEEQKLIDILKLHEELSIDVLCLKSSMSTSKVSSLLLNLEFSGLVKALPGKIFKIIA